MALCGLALKGQSRTTSPWKDQHRFSEFFCASAQIDEMGLAFMCNQGLTRSRPECPYRQNVNRGGWRKSENMKAIHRLQTAVTFDGASKMLEIVVREATSGTFFGTSMGSIT